jgi:hypothetical protein
MPGAGSLRSKLPELVVEAAMVVFAVLVALGVEEWREERQMREFAGRAQSAVLAEVRANLEEFQATGPGLDSTLTALGRFMRDDDVSILPGGVGLVLPDFSSAAWHAAEVSQAATYLDYEWVIRVSRAYEVYDTYSRVSNDILDDLSTVIGRMPTVDGVRAMYGRLIILTEIHRQVQERLEALLAEEEELR